MANHEQEDGTAADSAAQTQPSLSTTGASRRRMAGLGASGVLMTLASNNAMAALVCKSPSGALSGNLSSQQPSTGSCQGRSPGYWKTHVESWPADVRPTDLFSKFFPIQSPLSRMTCSAVIQGEKADRHNLGRHLLATYLNVATGRIGFLSRSTVADMWDQIQANRQYIPAKGAAPWSATQLVDYLTSTML